MAEPAATTRRERAGAALHRVMEATPTWYGERLPAK
jgi:hypothetical protein